MSEKRDPDLNEEEDIILDAIREDHWRDVDKEGEDNNNIHALRWEVYVKDKEELIKRYLGVRYTSERGCDKSKQSHPPFRMCNGHINISLSTPPYL